MPRSDNTHPRLRPRRTRRTMAVSVAAVRTGAGAAQGRPASLRDGDPDAVHGGPARFGGPTAVRVWPLR